MTDILNRYQSLPGGLFIYNISARLHVLFAKKQHRNTNRNQSPDSRLGKQVVKCWEKSQTSALFQSILWQAVDYWDKRHTLGKTSFTFTATMCKTRVQMGTHMTARRGLWLKITFSHHK